MQALQDYQQRFTDLVNNDVRVVTFWRLRMGGGLHD